MRLWGPGLVLVLLLTLIGCATVKHDLERADGYLAQEQHAAALVMYRNALPRLDPIDRGRIAETHARIAECLAALGRPTEAFVELQRALEQNPGNITARVRLGELYLSTGNAARALQESQLVLHVRPENPDALTISGAAHSMLGNAEAAIAALNRAFELDPTRHKVAIGLAELHARNNELTAARAILDRAAARQPSNPEPLLAQARLEESIGESEAAERAYRSAIAARDTPETNLRLAQFLQRAARITEAEEILKKLDTRSPGRTTLLADFELISGRVLQAAQSYMVVMQGLWAPPEGKRRPAAPANIAARLIEAEIEIANAEAAHSPAAAAEALLRARAYLDRHRNHLDSASVSVLEAEIGLAEGDLARARVHAMAAVAAGPGSSSAHYVLGLVKYRSGDKVGAQDAWLAAIEQNTDFVPAQLAIASLGLETGQPRTAEEFASAVVLEEPANLRALLLYARALAAQKRFDAAGSILARAEALDPARPEPHVVAGQIALARDRIAEALVRFQQAVVLNPQSLGAVDGITRVYQRGAITPAMLRKMERIAGNHPASAALMEVVGRLYAGNGRHRDAARCFERALAIEAGRHSAATALVAAYVHIGQVDDAAETAVRAGAGPAEILAAIRAQKNNDRAAAIRHYEAAIRRGERTGYAANNLAWLYAEQGTNLERALHLAQTATEARPADAAIIDTLGMVHLKRREYSEAVEAFRKAVELAERAGLAEAPAFRAHLAQAYALAGQPQDAAAERARARGAQQ